MPLLHVPNVAALCRYRAPFSQLHRGGGETSHIKMEFILIFAEIIEKRNQAPFRQEAEAAAIFDSAPYSVITETKEPCHVGGRIARADPGVSGSAPASSAHACSPPPLRRQLCAADINRILSVECL